MTIRTHSRPTHAHAHAHAHAGSSKKAALQAGQACDKLSRGTDAKGWYQIALDLPSAGAADEEIDKQAQAALRKAAHSARGGTGHGRCRPKAGRRRMPGAYSRGHTTRTERDADLPIPIFLVAPAGTPP